MSTDFRAIAELFRASLERAGGVTRVFRIDALDRLNIPVAQACHMPDAGGAVIGHGYGLDDGEAHVGALGELCEEVHLAAWLRGQPLEHGSHRTMRARHGASGVADPLQLCLPAGSRFDDHDELAWVAARRYPSDERVFVPLEWIAISSGQMRGLPALIVPITNGLGAGLDLSHALSHGIMELLQRDGNVLDYRAFDRGEVVTLDVDPGDDVRHLRDTLSAAGIDVTVKLASDERGIANLYVVGDDRGRPTHPIQVTACGEAAHPDPIRGLRKAMLEFIGSRSRKVATHGGSSLLSDILPPDVAARQRDVAAVGKDEPRAVAAMTEWLGRDVTTLRDRLAGSVFAHRTERPLSSLPSSDDASGASARRLERLAARLSDEGRDILWVDASPDDGPVRVVKVVVTGLESETMSYHRIGADGVRRLRARGDALLAAEPGGGRARVQLRDDQEACVGGPAFLDIATIDARVDSLYPLYREPGAFAAELARGRS